MQIFLKFLRNCERVGSTARKKFKYLTTSHKTLLFEKLMHEKRNETEYLRPRSCFQTQNSKKGCNKPSFLENCAMFELNAYSKAEKWSFFGMQTNTDGRHNFSEFSLLLDCRTTNLHVCLIKRLLEKHFFVDCLDPPSRLAHVVAYQNVAQHLALCAIIFLCLYVPVVGTPTQSKAWRGFKAMSQQKVRISI